MVGALPDIVPARARPDTSPRLLRRPGLVHPAVDTATLDQVAVVAAIVYFVFVLPVNTLKERRKRGEEAGPTEPTEVELLAEIRDLLTARELTARERSAVDDQRS